jgi:hypothetical protein
VHIGNIKMCQNYRLCFTRPLILLLICQWTDLSTCRCQLASSHANRFIQIKCYGVCVQQVNLYSALDDLLENLFALYGIDVIDYALPFTWTKRLGT